MPRGARQPPFHFEMRIWLLQRSEPTPHDNEGAQRAMRTGIVARVLVRRGHRVLWWTSTFDHYNRRHRFDFSKRFAVEEGYDIQYLRGCGYKKNVSLDRLRDNRQVAAEFRRIASEERDRPEAIVASLPTAELLLEGIAQGRRTGAPVLADIRDLWPDVFADVAPPWARPLVRSAIVPMRAKVRQACTAASGIIGLTEEFLDWGLRHAGRTRSERDGVFPMGYDTVSYSDERLQEARAFWDAQGVCLGDGKLRAVFFGTFGRTNDLMPVIEAARLLESRASAWQFVLCGRGERFGEAQRAAEGLRSVLFPGWVGGEPIRVLLERADIGIAPYINSENYVKNMPNKPAEYLSGGVPIACSLNRGVLPKMMRDQKCGFAYGNDARQLAERLSELEKDREILRRMRRHAAETFTELFDSRILYGQLVEHIERVVGLSNRVAAHA